MSVRKKMKAKENRLVFILVWCKAQRVSAQTTGTAGGYGMQRKTPLRQTVNTFARLSKTDRIKRTKKAYKSERILTKMTKMQPI